MSTAAQACSTSAVPPRTGFATTDRTAGDAAVVDVLQRTDGRIQTIGGPAQSAYALPRQQRRTKPASGALTLVSRVPKLKPPE